MERNDIQGWMDEHELEWLYRTAAGMRSVVEIGSWKGRSTKALLEGCGGLVYAVDHFKGSSNQNLPGGPHFEARTVDIRKAFMNNVGHYPNLVVLAMDSIDAAGLFLDRSVDMVFIDGNHQEASMLADLEAWFPKCRRLICGHDKGEDGVPAALGRFFGAGGGVKDEAGTIWSYRIK